MQSYSSKPQQVVPVQVTIDANSPSLPQPQHHGQPQQRPALPLAHNGQNNHNQRRSSKVPLRELPASMPAYQHPVYPQLYCVQEAHLTSYQWECIILDLDRTIIHGKRLSVKRWRKYVENGTIPSLAENQCSKWHRHIHRKGHQMHPFIRGRTMIYYRPFTWHLLAVLDYLKSHFGTKIIVCTKAGEHYAASVLAALISNFTSANPDLIDDVYNFHDLHDDAEDEGKPKKPLRLICNRHDIDPAKTLIVDDNATSWFDADRTITNFWMPPCYGYQIHDIDNELQLLCKYLWDPVQKHHLEKKAVAKPQQLKQQEEALKASHLAGARQPHGHLPQLSNATESSAGSCLSPNASLKREIISRQSPKSVCSHTASSTLSSPSAKTLSPTNQRYLQSPHGANRSNNGNSPKNLNELHSYPSDTSLEYQQSVSSAYSHSMASTEPGSEPRSSHQPHHSHHLSNHNKSNAVDKLQFAQLLEGSHEFGDEQKANAVHMPRGYNKRKYKDAGNELVSLQTSDPSMHSVGPSASRRSPKSPGTKTKKKGYFFESKSRGSKKLAKMIGK